MITKQLAVFCLTVCFSSTALAQVGAPQIGPAPGLQGLQGLGGLQAMLGSNAIRRGQNPNAMIIVTDPDPLPSPGFQRGGGGEDPCRHLTPEEQHGNPLCQHNN
jgi:hypothetical protein